MGEEAVTAVEADPAGTAPWEVEQAAEWPASASGDSVHPRGRTCKLHNRSVCSDPVRC